MTLQDIVLWTVVFCIGVPSARWNPTAFALVLAKFAGRIWFWITGDSLPTDFYMFPDIMVMAVIMAKQEYCDHQPYRGTLHQLKCVLLERSPADRAVLLIFAISWALYVAPIHDFYRWWLLWAGVILQFLFASTESLEVFWRSRGNKSEKPIIDRHLFAFPCNAAMPTR